ncbi:unnamed protein product [Aspergillus oryzae var. brunneus]|uniref:Unnamed protein product n=2 Tax=Aspergillus oryzae TaxID=5062 RepID=A0AAN4YHZ0_ASPOZ|nr:hypothetical protein NYO67_2394 [Aspergillus flavus]KOC12026.1 hypothetical protein AFLA70_632g000441 [Aspergillus flavus AF70]GMG06805.1 unnamed protein product [Aspergillus oryzae]GMG53727.1 unnamed protein product [Aspergillus oryzae var. brunneus]RAQ44818.1 hypothetical protein AFGD_009390 [Aspergillus flavus]
MTIARVNRTAHPSPTPTPSPTFACRDIAPPLLGYEGVMGDVIEINEVADVVSASVDVRVSVVVSVVLAGVKLTLVDANVSLVGLGVELTDTVVDDDIDVDNVVVVVVESFALLVILK